MSLEAWGDEGMYDDNLDERASEAGYLSPDAVEDLKDLLRHIDTPTVHSKGHAAMILIDQVLNPRPLLQGSDEATAFNWASTKLGRTSLI